MPTVSVVTCTYNRGHLIGETIASVLQQSFQDFEYIIIDDGSDDNTEAIVNSFEDTRIQYFKHTRTGGHLSLLRNVAHSKCTGEYIAYVDSDDLWEKSKLAIQINRMMLDPTIGFSYTDISTFNENGILKKTFYGKKGEFAGNVFYPMLWNKLIICHTTLVIRSTCLKKIGPMDESLHSGDHDRVFFLSRHFNAFAVYQPLVQVRKHSQNSTGSDALSLRLLEEHHRTLDKLYQQQLISKREYSKAYALTCYSFGVQVLATGNNKMARHYFITSLMLRPWNARALFRWIILLAK